MIEGPEEELRIVMRQDDGRKLSLKELEGISGGMEYDGWADFPTYPINLG